MRVLIATLLLASCSAQSMGRALLVQARDEDGRALAGLVVEIDGMPATRTDAEGKARISLGSEGPARARIAVSCPEGSRESNPRHVARHVEGTSARLELSFVCRPAQRMLAIVVRAEGGAGSVLRADGEPLGTVAADGTLITTVWRAPESELQLMLDTTAVSVRPRNPLREHRVADRDEVIVFDQPLQAPATKSGSPKRVGRMTDTTKGFGGRR
ncbi:MAG TPA: hypothetical protein VFX59_00865 [Polyangiales bacterium]|nr:hypothetical protein [Polyangiales bacterium]